MSEYIIGIDGGGTSTDGALFRMDGTVVATHQGGFGNFRVHPDVAKDNLVQTIDSLVADIELSELKFIQIGVAGIPNEDDKERLEQDLARRYDTPVSIVTDALIALYSIRRDSDQCVIMVLGGTGSAIMIGDGSQLERIGGYGHLLGDEGSAYHLAITALRQIIDTTEHNQPLTPLSKAILNQIHAKDHLEIKDFVYSNTKQDIARLSRFIATHAEQGDEEAIRLFQDEGALLAKQTVLALNKVPHCEHVVIGFRGSFLLDAPLVKEALVHALDEQQISYTIDKQPVKPIIGAFFLGLNQI